MADLKRYVRKNGSTVFKGQYVDHNGRRRTYTGTESEAYTRKQLARLKLVSKEIKLGLRPAPKSSDTTRVYALTVGEYVDQGNAHGGRNGFGWGKHHGAARARLLKIWGDKLRTETLHDLECCLPRVERVLQELQKAGRAGKTLANWAEALKAFCLWCVDRGYLEADPLKHLGRFDTTPRSQRRCLTAEEIQALLQHCLPSHRLIYQVALGSGLRRGELRALKAKHLDTVRGGLQLEAAWTKNRRAGFQPLAKCVLDELVAVAQGKDPETPLLTIPTSTALMVRADLKRAGVPWFKVGEGKVDFHALRVAFISFVFDAGASVKEAQTLARHQTPNLTLNTYGRTRAERLTGVAELVGGAMFISTNCTQGAPKQDAGSA